MVAKFNMSRRKIISAAVSAIAFAHIAHAQSSGDRKGLCSARARQTATGVRYEAAVVEVRNDGTLTELCSVTLPGRGHGVIAAPERGEFYVCARRPGAWILRIRAADGTVLARYSNGGRRWLQGHVCLSADGSHVYASEVALDERSSIAVLDARTLTRLGTLSIDGTEPHDLLLADASTLLVAHGGRRDTFRTSDALQPDARCESALSWIDIATGRTMHAIQPEDSRVSLRHLAKVDHAKWVVGAQSDATEHLEVVGLATTNGLRWLTGSSGAADNYIASVAVSNREMLAAAPHSGIVLAWNEVNSLPESRAHPRACGIVVSRDRTWISDEFGSIEEFKTTNAHPTGNDVAWDNHMTVISI